MLIISDYSQFRFTKIEAVVFLDECPSDVKENEYWVELDVDSYSEDSCFIGNQKVEHIQVCRNSNKDSSAKWNLMMVIEKSLCETEVHSILAMYCDIISRKCAQSVLFQDYGFSGFSFDPLSVRRFYSSDGISYTDYDCVRVGLVKFSSKNKIRESVLSLPKHEITTDPLKEELARAYMIALKSKDIVARYILMYYLLEIIYKSNSWGKYANSAKLKDGKRWRYLALQEYFESEFHICEYSSFGKNHTITSDIFEQVITVRNDLTHRADQSKIRNLLYYHLIPIIQAVLKT